jgi:hypothetical protein
MIRDELIKSLEAKAVSVNFLISTIKELQLENKELRAKASNDFDISSAAIDRHVDNIISLKSDLASKQKLIDDDTARTKVLTRRLEERTKFLEEQIKKILANKNERADIFEAKATKANAEKRKLLSIMKCRHFFPQGVWERTMKNYNLWLKQRRRKKGGK